jgi:hypothetical protein
MSQPTKHGEKAAEGDIEELHGIADKNQYEKITTVSNKGLGIFETAPCSLGTRVCYRLHGLKRFLEEFYTSTLNGLR